MLKRALEGVLTESEAAEFVSAFDQVGEIIIVRIPDPLLARRFEIGRALLDGVKIARSVFCQASAVDGEYRTRKLDLIAGSDDTTTTYRESGCRFVVDVENAFFSPRLSHERERIASLVRDGESVLNMFGGIGMFSVIAAMNAACTVYSVDSNPRRVKAVREKRGAQRALRAQEPEKGAQDGGPRNFDMRRGLAGGTGQVRRHVRQDAHAAA